MPARSLCYSRRSRKFFSQLLSYYSPFGERLQNFYISLSVFLHLCVLFAEACVSNAWCHEAHFAAVAWSWCSCLRYGYRGCWRRRCWHGHLLLLLSSRGSRASIWAPTQWLTARRNCNCKRRCWIWTNRTWSVCLSACVTSFSANVCVQSVGVFWLLVSS